MKSSTLLVAMYIAVLCVGPNRATAGTASYDFRSGVDSNLWTHEDDRCTGGGYEYTTEITSDGLKISKPANPGGANFTASGFSFNQQVVGDFDVQLLFCDASLQVVDGANGNILELIAWNSGLNDNFCTRLTSDWGSGGNLAYSVWGDQLGVVGTTLTTDTSGGLRMTRVGSAATTYRLDQGNWTPFYSCSDWNTDPVTFGFNIMNHTTTDAISGTFRSFTITNAAVAEPSSFILLGLGAGSLIAYCWWRRKHEVLV
jgi:hypothetical protein